jgi:acyl transferase domain-containing protein
VNSDNRNSTGLEVAIIAMAGRYPGAPDADALWRNLRDGIEPISTFSKEELSRAGVPRQMLASDHYVPSGFVLDDIEQFDAGFFGFAPSEAEMLDPQHRIFLECAWEAMEQAGYNPVEHVGPIGIYAGSALSSYLIDLLQNRPEAIERTSSVQVLTANDKDYLATRVAYAMNLEGPAVTVQTACSTSLVAVHLACQSLIAGECEIALAGGAAINTRGKLGYLYEEGSILSPDGHCRPFSADAAGTVFGSGAGVVVLKRLSDAIEDGDHIRAVILGSAINNDGSHKIGFTAPRIEGQARVIDDALQIADVSPEDISCIEAHGTATSLGDPMEVAALTRTFRAGTDQEQFCALGSIKGNFGHLDTAAGVAGLSKLVLALENGAIPPSLNFTEPNAEIDFKRSPFYVNTALHDWPTNGKPRRAGVSSFGLGGTNAHVVLEEAPQPPPSAPSRARQLLVFSARSAEALEQAAGRLATHLEANPGINLADAAFTLQRGRALFGHRRAVVCRDVPEAVAMLTGARSQEFAQTADDTVDREVVFAFPGQGSQYPGMGRGLYTSEPL